MDDTTNTSGAIQSRDDYEDDSKGKYAYWVDELMSSEKQRKRWHKQAAKIVRRFVDERRSVSSDLNDSVGGDGLSRLNLFHSNVQTLMSMLYGNLPTVDVARRYADADDDVSRVASEMMERMLNNDIQDNGEDYNSILRACLQDRLLSGLGCARVRYEMETEVTQVMMDNGTGVMVEVEQEQLVWEEAPIEYIHWQDVLWSWARTWADVTWVAYRTWLTRDEAAERFGEGVAKQLTYKRQTVNENKDDTSDDDQNSAWEKAEIWEVWDKIDRKVCWVSKGYSRLLDHKDDPLELDGFFPSPPFFLANQTTTLYQPTPDFHLAQDLYNEIDILQTRITTITTAIQATGVYNADAGPEVGRLMNEGSDNTLIPVKNWSLFVEKGGLEGAMQFLPLRDFVETVDKLRQIRDETIQLLYQVTGMADVMRGSSQGQYEGVGTSQLKAKFGSVRVQALQDSFAKFASDLMKIKAEVIMKHFSPETIAKSANIENTFDAELAPQALALLAQPELARLRIVIRPESVAMVDFAALKQERTDFIQALALFMQSSAPLMEQDKSMAPFLFQLLQWGLSGFKGAQDIEGVIDKAIEQQQKKAKEQEGQPDPEQQKMQMQMQMQMQMEQAKQQAELAKIQAKAQADASTREIDKQADIETAIAQHQAKLREIEAEVFASIAETQAKLQADLAVEQAQASANIQQTVATAESEITKDAANMEMEVQKGQVQTALKIQEIAASSAAKIRELEKKPTESKKDEK